MTLSVRPYRISLMVCHLDVTQCPHRTDESRFLLDYTH